MDQHTIALLAYMIGIPLVSILLAGGVVLDGNLKRRKLDKQLADTRRQQMDALIGENI